VSALHYGLTPKMKPISPRRSALIAALDVGSSKVACLIARLRPHPPQQVLTRRSHAIRHATLLEPTSSAVISALRRGEIGFIFGVRP